MLQLDLSAERRRAPDLEFDAAWPPSINHYYRQATLLPRLEDIVAYHQKNGFVGFWKWAQKRTRVTPLVGNEGKIFRDSLAYRLNRHRGMFGVDDVALEVQLFPPTARKPDVDNRLKCLLDSIEYCGIIENDSQIAQLLVVRGGVRKPGGITCRLWRWQAR